VIAWLSLADIAGSGRALPAEFACRLALRADGAAPPRVVTVVCETVLRLLPGRRVVARARVDGSERLLKLFVGPGAARRCRREARGCLLIAAAGLPTPACRGELHDFPEQPSLLARRPLLARWRDVAGCGLLFEYLAAARPLDPMDPALLSRAAAALGRLHRFGALHYDLHSSNFLFSAADGRDTLYLVDGDAVRRTWRRRVGRRAGLRNLARLCAQRSVGADGDLDAVYAAYAASRGWPAGPEVRRAGGVALARSTRAERRIRVRDYLHKALRDCTEFRCERTWRHRFQCVRAAWGAELEAFVQAPEAWMSGATTIKAGNSATVVRGRLDGRAVVVKRYNLKSPVQAMRRMMEPVPRFRRAWLNGQRLHLLGIATARPLALLEQRVGPLRGRAYLVMEDLGDADLASEIAAQGLDHRREADIVALFRALGDAGLSHGDTKASNFLVTDAGVGVVDLDSMIASRRGIEADRTRFLRNFADAPEIRQRLAAALHSDRGGAARERESAAG
jgi:tRNA A-37 threonylcarbamoyl transferase component Bud32